MKSKPSIVDPGWNFVLSWDNAKMRVYKLNRMLKGEIESTEEERREEMQGLINLHIPFGWSLSIDDVDKDRIETYVNMLQEVYDALTTLYLYRCSCERLDLCKRIFNQHWRIWLANIRREFNQNGRKEYFDDPNA